MSKMMVYALKGAVGGAVENVWGHDMQVMAIDSSNKAALEASIANGYTDKPQDIIEQIEAKQMQKENTAIKGQLANGADKARIDELEGQLATALSEIAGFGTERTDANAVINEKVARISELEMQLADSLVESAKFESDAKHAKDKLAIYELSKDKNGNSKIDYEEMTNAELQALLDQRKVEYNKRDGKDVLIQKAKDSE